MSVCLIIFMFFKSCKPICEPEITLVLYHLENKNNFTFSGQVTNLTKRGNQHCPASEILKKNTDLSHIYLAVYGWKNLPHPWLG